jgi:hypothetical protein
VLNLLQKYSDVPMSLADACLVRMTETLPDPVILTTDSDFRIYRRHSRQMVPCMSHPDYSLLRSPLSLIASLQRHRGNRDFKNTLRDLGYLRFKCLLFLIPHSTLDTLPSFYCRAIATR